MKQVRKRLTYANVMSSLAVFFVLGGGAAFAASHLAKNSVGKKQLQANSVTSPKIKKGAVTEAKLGGGAVTAAKLAGGSVTGPALANGVVTNEKLANGAVTGSKVNVGSLGTVPSAAVAGSLANMTALKLTKVDASATALTEEGAQAVAAPVPLYEDGHFLVYGKCFVSTGGGNTIFSKVFIATKQNGAIFDSDDEELSGEAPDGYLNVDTLEELREVIDDSAEENEANMQYEGDTEFGATAADGYTIQGVNQVAEKAGSPAAGDGPYGPGNVCLFSGYVLHS